MTDVHGTDDGLSVKRQPQGMICGVSFPGIDADLQISQALRKEPGVSPSGDSRLKSAVPQDRSRRALEIRHTGNDHCLVPDAAGIRDTFIISQSTHKGKNLPKRQPGMNCHEPVPDLEGDVSLAAGNLVRDHVYVDIAIRGEDAIQ